MRLHSLTIEGFGPFGAAHSVDFDAFADTGVYLIAGATGSGKSSILDAIVYALYGSVPRYEGMTQKRARLRSDFADAQTPTRVELVFSVASNRYRVTRSPEYARPKQRGAGVTVQKASIAVDHLSTEGWQTIATQARDAAVLIDDIVGLRREQFEQVVMLAQGRFAEFLQADSGARAGILRQLFGTHRFAALTQQLASDARDGETLRESLEEQAAACVLRAATALGSEDPAPATIAEIHAQAETKASSLGDAAALAETARDRAAAEAAAARQLLADIAERDRALERLAITQRQSDAVEQARVTLAEAETALELRTVLVEADSARRLAASAHEEESQAEQRLDASDLTDSAAAMERMRTTLRALDEALSTEARLPTLQQELDSATRSEMEEQRALNELREQRTEIPQRIAQQREELDQLRATAADAPQRQTALEEALAAAELPNKLESALIRHTTALESLESRLDRRASASREAERLLRAFLAGAAGRLAETLESGTPCPVCGSLEHPDAATPGADHADEDSVEQAHAREREATELLDDARTAERTAYADVEQLRTALGTAQPEQLREALELAKLAHSASAAAIERIGVLESKISSLESESNTLLQRIDAQTETVSAASNTRALAAHAVQSAQEQLAQARKGTESLSATRAAVAGRLQRTESFVAARAKRIEAEAALAKAESALSEALQAHEQESEEAARSRHRERPERDRLRALINEHESALAGIRAVLDREAIRTIPERLADGAPDLEALEEAEQRTDQQHQQALRAAADAAAIWQQVGRELAEHQRLTRELDELGSHAAALSRLAQTLDGRGPNAQRMQLETYVLAAGLESILEAANQRLASMTQGRYTLLHDEAEEGHGKRGGLGIAVLDDFTGAARAVQSLSGGETFLTSLALALGLADVVQQEAGGVQLDTLFIDEGFGALDAEVLELAMQMLSELQTGGRSIGVISHVQNMQERIPERIRVERRADGRGSRIIS